MRSPRRSLVRAAAVVGVAGAVAVGGATVSRAVVGPAPTPPAVSPVQPSGSAVPEGAGERGLGRAERQAAQVERKAERKAAQAERKAARQGDAGPPSASTSGGAERAEPVDLVCDPSRSHGQNVSAYARSLPSGPGRGRQISAAARSDCGKPPR